ncbi:hypothetical protein PENSPDRAFT_753471 [Peniophora sp. CONT]|nr:hypothetical protein PENSPDRAFT_753471 [Peniophora sp. CONT]
MRLIFSSDYITDTVLLDDQNRQVYATTSSTFGRHTEVLKFDSGASGPSKLATLDFHNWTSDMITLRGREMMAKDYIDKPSWTSSRRVFSTANRDAFEWVPETFGNTWSLHLLNGPQVGRSHSRSLGLMGPTQHPPYLEFSDDPRVLSSLDELIVTYVYLRIKQEKQRRNRANHSAAHRHRGMAMGGAAGANNIMLMQGGMGGGMGGGMSGGMGGGMGC